MRPTRRILLAFASMLGIGMILLLLHDRTGASVGHGVDRVFLIDRHMTFDFEVGQQERSVDCIVMNQTNVSVKIIGFHSSCSCTIVDNLPTVMAPGERLAIPVKVHPPESGSIDGTVELISTTPSRRF